MRAYDIIAEDSEDDFTTCLQDGCILYDIIAGDSENHLYFDIDTSHVCRIRLGSGFTILIP